MDTSSFPPATQAHYPFNNPAYHPAFDDGSFCLRELKAETRGWRSEKYAATSNVLILDRYDDRHAIGYRSDTDIQTMLNSPMNAQPRIRFVLLEPTPQEQLLHAVRKDPGTVQHTNELIDAPTEGVALQSQLSKQEPSQLNISQASLLGILSRYHIPDKAASHIRGQEQVFGSQASCVETAAGRELVAFDFWYAIRARAYFNELDQKKYHKEADLKITIITHYEPKTRNSLVILKYRSFNDLPSSLQEELTERLKAFVKNDSTTQGLDNPIALALFHFTPVIQYYRRGARDPRDTVRTQEAFAHKPRRRDKGFQEIDIKALHFIVGSLDQNIVQLDFALDVIDRLRAVHKQFYTEVKGHPTGTARNWLYTRVENELDRYESHIKYIREGQKEVARKAERLMDLEFRLSTRYQTDLSARMAEYAMRDSTSMKNIAIVTMLFLPVTAVAAVLGTNLVAGPARPGDSSGDEHIFWSSQWWVLPACAVPLTCVTFFVWFLRQSRTVKALKQRLDLEQGYGD